MECGGVMKVWFRDERAPGARRDETELSILHLRGDKGQVAWTRNNPDCSRGFGAGGLLEVYRSGEV